MERCLANVGWLSEEGTPIRITYRSIVKSAFIQVYDYVLHYQRWLKTEYRKVIRYVNVQVVLLFILLLVYQDF